MMARVPIGTTSSTPVKAVPLGLTVVGSTSSVVVADDVLWTVVGAMAGGVVGAGGGVVPPPPPPPPPPDSHPVPVTVTSGASSLTLSVSVETTEAVFAIEIWQTFVPGSGSWGAVALIVTVALAPPASVPRSHSIVLPGPTGSHVPWDAETETTVRLLSRSSVTTTFVAEASPEFWTVIV
jgi:hypothetical protein